MSREENITLLHQQYIVFVRSVFHFKLRVLSGVKTRIHSMAINY